MKGKKCVEITWEVCGEEFYWVESDGPYFGGIVKRDNCECHKGHDGNHSLVWLSSSTLMKKNE